MINDVIEWDVYNWSHALTHWSHTISQLSASETRVLCLGERNGGLSLWFALQGFQVICSDFNGPKQEANQLHERYGVADRIQYADINIFKIPFPDNTFDIVACKSVIGGLKLDYRDKSSRTVENQKLAVEEIRRVLKPGGIFCGAENMRGSWVHMTARKLLKGDKIGWRHLRVTEIYQLFDEFTNKDFQFYGFLGSYYRHKMLNKVSSIIDKVLSTIMPRQWLYIAFIVAKK